MRLSATLLATILLGATALTGCTTTANGGRPAEVIRYHLGEPLERGTVVVQPAEGGDGLADRPFADAVARGLGTAGYVTPPPGTTTQFIALVEVRRRAVDGPPRQSPFSIGIGAGGFSGGRNSGVGLGGGVAIPIGRGGSRRFEGTLLSVTIKRRVDQSPVWEGQAQTVERGDALQSATAEKLARALFTGFPGESGRSIVVR